jgi:tetratricopeptide (TPR) repeat protein
MQDLQKTLERQCSRLGSNHPDVAETLTIMAMMKSEEGDKEASVELLHEALHIRKSVGDKAEFARTLHKLGDVYTQQKEYQSSLSCHTDALNLERLVHGYQHPEIAKSLNKIGSVYARQGDFGVAISNHQHALQILKDCIGEDLSHPLVAQTLICIGAVYYKERNSLETIRAKSDGYNTFIDSGMLDVIARAHEQRGSYRMAIAFFEEKLQLLRNRDKRGMNKQEVAEALARLGTLSREAGLYLEALDYYDETENIQTAMGRNQVEIARGRLMKGTVLYHLGQYKDSLRLFKEAQTILQATVGNDQQLLIGETFQWIGKVQTELCDYESAMKALKVALEIQTVALGSDHPMTLKSRLAIASVLLHKAKMDASLNLLTAILETQGRIHGPKHPNLAETMYYIGKAYMMKGDIVSAMKFFEESFFMAEKFLGHDHPSQASTLHCIADLQKAKRRFKKSLQLLTSVLNMRRDTLGDGHISVAMTLCSIAACHAATGRFAESTKYIDEALPIAEHAVGKMHPAVGLILVAHGNLFLRKCQFEQAREMIERGLEIYVSCNVAKKHPHRLEAEETLERVERDEALCV